MSVTTQTDTITPGVVRLLADYELTHSGEDHGASEALAKEQSNSTTHANPGWWPTDHHGIPPYRPINYNLDREQRPWGSSPVETGFVMVMLNGVGTVACISKIWRQTGGRINDRIFRFSIGGER